MIPLPVFDGLYFDRTRLVGVQALAGPGRVVSATLSPTLDAITHITLLEAAHPQFDAPTTGAIVGPWLYVIANSQLSFSRPPRETIIVRLPLEHCHHRRAGTKVTRRATPGTVSPPTSVASARA